MNYLVIKFKKILLFCLIMLRYAKNLLSQQVYFRIVNKNYFKRSMQRLASYENRYIGKRCFILGNGPSLRMDDLMLLKNEYTFGSNFLTNLDVFKFNLSFYFVNDKTLLNSNKLAKKINELSNNDISVFIPYNVLKNSTIKIMSSKVIFYRILNNPLLQSKRAYSSNLIKGIYTGYTVTYSMIEAAVYMGFKEIYLLGVDNTVGDRNHFYENSTSMDLVTNEKCELSFKFLKDSLPQEIKIINSTRGGNLSVFPRHPLESIHDIQF
jgi:hypothetical protein